MLSNAPYGYRYVKKSDGAPAHDQVVLHEARVVQRIDRIMAQAYELIHSRLAQLAAR